MHRLKVRTVAVMAVAAGLGAVAAGAVAQGVERSTAIATSVIRLACTYSYLVNESGDRFPTGGNYLLTVRYSRDGKVVIEKQDVGSEFVGTMTSGEIRGETEYEVGDAIEKEQIAINRFSGTFWVRSNHGLMFLGTCRHQDRQ